MGNCKDCKHWSQDRNEFWELTHLKYEGKELNEQSEYGACSSDSVKWFARYDGGYNAELLTRHDFGCVLFEARSNV